MQLSQARRTPRRISLTPLIDVVFLLLIFFMLSSTFLKFTTINIAGGNAGAGQGDVSNLVLVRVHKDGKIDVNGQVVLLKNLAVHLADIPVPGKMKIAVKALEGAKMQHVVDAIEHLGGDQPRDVFVVK